MKKRISLLLVWAMVLTLIGTVAPEQRSDAAGKVKISKSSLTLKVGQSKKLTLKNAKGKVKWSSLKKSVATVDKKGVVKAKKAGTAVIVATHMAKSYMCTVTVKKKKQPVTEDPDDPEDPDAIEDPDDPEETEEPDETPTPTPEATSTPKPTATPTPAMSDTQTNRLKLISYLKSNGSIDTSGNWAIEDKQTKSNGMMMSKASTDGELLILQVGSGLNSSGTIMSSVATVVFGVEKDVSSVNCIITVQSSYGTKLEDSMVELITTTTSIHSEDNHLSWSVDKKNGNVFTNAELYELADTTMDLFYPALNVLLMVKGGGMTLDKLGFGS